MKDKINNNLIPDGFTPSGLIDKGFSHDLVYTTILLYSDGSKQREYKCGNRIWHGKIYRDDNFTYVDNKGKQ